MSKPAKYNHLFSPITIGSMTLKNRAVMPAMGTAYANMDNTVNERLVQYLARRARGGTGLIITEVTAVTPRGKGFPNELGIWSDEFIPSLAKIPEAIHLEGGKAAIQLHHAGRETFPEAVGGLPEAPSAIPSVILQQPCEEMSIERIQELVNAFASAAVRARAAGFDAVEIHSAHGYLLNQFLSPFSNQRQDAYGGSEENRSRFVLEIVTAARKSLGPDYPIHCQGFGRRAHQGRFRIGVHEKACTSACGCRGERAACLCGCLFHTGGPEHRIHGHTSRIQPVPCKSHQGGGGCAGHRGGPYQ